MKDNRDKLNKEYERLKKMWESEEELSRGARFVFGIDEAGRGPLMGPVTAACVILPKGCVIPYLNDSKKLSPARRESLYDEIISKALSYAVSNVGEKRIDEVNILNATYEAFNDAFNKCMDTLRMKTAESLTESDLSDGFDELPGLSDTLVLIDGNRIAPGISYRQQAVVHGDGICPSVAAASILAKVTRDNLMVRYDSLYPGYGFKKHKGYGTKEHIEAVRRLGPCPAHRLSFLKNIL